MKERKDTKKIEKRQRNCDKGIINGKGFEEERYFGEESMRRKENERKKLRNSKKKSCKSGKES